MSMATHIPHGPGMWDRIEAIQNMQRRRRTVCAIKTTCADLMVSTCIFIPKFTRPEKSQ